MVCQHEHHSAIGKSANSLAIAFGLNLLFTVIEIAGGFWTNSIAILSDALHDAGDSAALGLAWYLQRLAGRASDSKFNYGYRRFSTLGALIMALLLIVGLGFVAWHAVARLVEPQPIRVSGMIVLACLGMLFNGAAVLSLRGDSSLNLRMARWHLLEDTFGWIAVFVGSLIIAATGWLIVDPILSLAISLFILWHVFKNLQKVLLVLLQAAPEGFRVDRFDQQVLEIEKVVGSHHTHSWTLDGDRHVFSTHLVMQDECDRDDIRRASQAVRELIRTHHFEHVTVEVELESEPCASFLEDESRSDEKP